MLGLESCRAFEGVPVFGCLSVWRVDTEMAICKQRELTRFFARVQGLGGGRSGWGLQIVRL